MRDFAKHFYARLVQVEDRCRGHARHHDDERDGFTGQQPLARKQYHEGRHAERQRCGMRFADMPGDVIEARPAISHAPMSTFVSVSEAVAWYADRPAIRVDAQKLRSMQELGLTVDGLLYPTRRSAAVEQVLRRQRMAGEE